MRTILPTRERRVDIPGDAASVEADPWPARPAAAPGGRRSVPHLLLGVLLVLACAVGALVVTVQFGGSRMVLATARAVGVGQVLSAADVRQVSLPADSDIRAVDASAAPTLLGRSWAVALRRRSVRRSSRSPWTRAGCRRRSRRATRCRSSWQRSRPLARWLSTGRRPGRGQRW